MFEEMKYQLVHEEKLGSLDARPIGRGAVRCRAPVYGIPIRVLCIQVIFIRAACVHIHIGGDHTGLKTRVGRRILNIVSFL
jgi:hypothetical protein